MLDTKVLVAALRSDRGASRKLLLSALDGRIRIASSVPLFLEYEAVLTRQEQLEACGIARREAIGVILETAVNGGADRLVTFNLRHLKRAAERFGILAVSPPDAWMEVQDSNETK